MGGPFRIDFGTQSNAGRYGPDTGPRHINAFVEQVIEGQPPLPIYAAEGLARFQTISGGGECRGMISSDSTLYVLSGKKFVSINLAGIVTDIGGIAGAGDVVMAMNGASPQQIAIVAEGVRYIWDGTTLSTISDSDLPPPIGVTFADQRLIYPIADGRLFWSDIDAAGSVDPLSFASAEGAPDGLVGAYAHKLDVWLPGSRTTEVWRSTANPDQPFQRMSGGFIQHGCSAPRSFANLGDTLFWVNDKAQALMVTGYAPQAISNQAVSRDIASVSDKKTILGFAYYCGGRGFYVLTCDEWTWQFNIGTQKWFERQSNGLPNWRGRHASQFNNQWIIGDGYEGKLYQVAEETYDEDGSPLVWTVRSAPMHAFPNRICVDRLHLDFTTGVGLNSTDPHESNPEVGMRYSDDGGKSWSNQLTRTLGADGDHQTRVTFDGLGETGRNGRIWELQVSAPVARALMYAAIEGDAIGT